MLEEFYFLDPRLVLIPIEHLSPRGVSAEMADLLAARRRDGAGLAALIDEAMPRYWSRSQALAERSARWSPPRLRNIAVVDAATAIPPYVQLLNTSTWTLFDCDFDSESNAELVAYLLVQGDRMAITGEVTMAAIHNAAYWFDRSVGELAQFVAAARRSRRPDAPAYAALADATGWLRLLHHETLRPPQSLVGLRPIAETGLFVSHALQNEPARLAAAWTAAAEQAVDGYYARYRKPEQAALRETLGWLSETAPCVVITHRDNRVIWDPEHPQRIGALRSELRRAAPETLRSIRDDLTVLAHHSQVFHDSAVAFAELPTAGADIGQDGYTYLYAGRRTLAYNLDEPHLRRLAAPALPFARSMLGARAYHEWCHLAVDAGWVKARGDLAASLTELATALDAVIAAAAPVVRRTGAADLEVLRAQHPPQRAVDWGGESVAVPGDTAGAALLRMLLPRFADYKANLLAVHLQSTDEREAYVRQNVRTLRGEINRAQPWRAFARYLYEMQYLAFSDVTDRRAYFLKSTWFDSDFIATGIVDEAQLDQIDAVFGGVLGALYVVEEKFRTVPRQ